MAAYNIKWKNMTPEEEFRLRTWQSADDKKMLCMQESWGKTAGIIEGCLKYMPNSQFRNCIGFYKDEPVCAIMFGVENGKVLKIYELLVRPKFRWLGIGKQAIIDVLSEENKFKLSKTYDKVLGYVLPENLYAMKLLQKLGFTREKKGSDDKYYEFGIKVNAKKPLKKDNDTTK